MRLVGSGSNSRKKMGSDPTGSDPLRNTGWILPKKNNQFDDIAENRSSYTALNMTQGPWNGIINVCK